MRPAYGESQNAAVVADSDLAELIVKKGRLRLVHCKYKSVKGQNTGNAGILGPARKLAKDRIGRTYVSGVQNLDIIARIARISLRPLCKKEGHRAGQAICDRKNNEK
nr:unnamed protein product [Callosobruchus analis]